LRRETEIISSSNLTWQLQSLILRLTECLHYGFCNGSGNGAVVLLRCYPGCISALFTPASPNRREAGRPAEVERADKAKAPLVRRGSALLPVGTLPFKDHHSSDYKSSGRAEDDGVEP
jgi:hypothetical protein